MEDVDCAHSNFLECKWKCKVLVQGDRYKGELKVKSEE